MLHPRLTPVGAAPGGSSSKWLSQIGPTGSWGDLAYTFRWGQGACGMYEVSWSMALPSDFTDPLLRRGALVELFDADRVGSALVMSEPTVGTGPESPWTFTATGVGREVEGENSFYAFDGSGDITTAASVAADEAMVRGWRVDGYEAGFPSAPFAAMSTDSPFTVGALLSAIGDSTGERWGVGQDGLVRFMTDPTVPEWHVVPGVAVLGVADDDYASVVYVRYSDSGTSAFETVFAPPSPSDVEDRSGRREYLVDLSDRPAMSAATAQGFADGILAKSKGRLAWTNSLTLTSNEIFTAGGVPADLSLVAAATGRGTMVRLHGIFDDLIATTGNTWVDMIIGQAQLVDGAQTIQLSPLGLAPRDLAAVVESVTGMAAA